MSRFWAKLLFVHRRLWRDDGLYPAAFLVGPAGSIGVLLAGLLWLCLPTIKTPTGSTAEWAVHEAPQEWETSPDAPGKPSSHRPLPATTADGSLAGFIPGWQSAIEAIDIGPTMDVDIKAVTAAMPRLSIDGPAIEMSQILRTAPDSRPLFAVAEGFLAVRKAGIYKISVELEHDSENSARCLARVAFAERRLISNIEIIKSGKFEKISGPAVFDLEPGLYYFAWAFGCWADRAPSPSGRMTILLAHPGQTDPEPLRTDDVYRPASKKS